MEAVHSIVMKITLLIMENHGKIIELCFLNFCGNPDISTWMLKVDFCAYAISTKISCAGPLIDYPFLSGGQAGSVLKISA